VTPPAGNATRTTVVRSIVADPTSTALLLAGPDAMDLWPGVRRVAKVSGRVVVEADLGSVAGDRAAAASVRALPPQRTATAYVTRFEWAGPGLPACTAELTLRRTAGGPHEHGTLAELVVTGSGFEGSVLDPVTLRGMATGFLANLAHAAELRNRAA
jgi:hypothetical protein